MKRPVKAIAIACATLLAALDAGAQSSAEVNAGVQFNFMNPGAISLGMGGAFIARADDATAAYANPAGLVNVARTEASVESRLWQYTQFTPARGHGFGDPTNEGVDTEPGVVEVRSNANVGGISFASAVIPGERWAIAVYKHELANFQAEPVSQGIFYDLPDGDIGRTFPSRSRIKLRISSFGTALALRLGERLALGVDVARAHFWLDSRTDRYDRNRNLAADFTRLPHSATLQSGSANAIRYGGGLQWQPTANFNVGAVYRRGPSFPVEVSREPDLPQSRCTGRFHVPDVYGAGVSYRPNPYLTINADVNRLTYSKLTRDFVTYNEKGQCTVHEKAPDYTVPDGTEYHLGMQYVFPEGFFGLSKAVIFNAGWWRDPPHSLVYDNETSPDRLLFGPNRADSHYTGGVSVSLSRWYEVSAGVDLSRRQRIVSLSGIARF